MKSCRYLLSMVALTTISGGIRLSPNLPEHTRSRRAALDQVEGDTDLSEGNGQKLVSKQASVGDSFAHTYNRHAFRDQSTDVGFDDIEVSKRAWYLDVENNDVGGKAWRTKDSVRAAQRSVGDEGQKTTMLQRRGESTGPKKLGIKELQQLVDSNEATPEQIEELNRRRAAEKKAYNQRKERYRELEAKVKGDSATPDEIEKYNKEKLRLQKQSQSGSKHIKVLGQLVRDEKATPEQRQEYQQAMANGRVRVLKNLAKKKAEQEALWASQGPPINISALLKEYSYKKRLGRLQSSFCYACRRITNWARFNPEADPESREVPRARWDDFIISRFPAEGVKDDSNSFCTALLQQLMRDNTINAAAHFLQNLRPPVPIASREVQERWEQETAKAVSDARDEQLRKIAEFDCDRKKPVTDPSSPSTEKWLTPVTESQSSKASSEQPQTATSISSDDHFDESRQNTFSANGLNFLRPPDKAIKENLGRWGSSVFRGLGGAAGRVAPPVLFEPGVRVAW